jgi:hypothetical protein
MALPPTLSMPLLWARSAERGISISSIDRVVYDMMGEIPMDYISKPPCRYL